MLNNIENIEIDVTIYDKEVEYGNTGMKVAALFRGYRVVGAEKIIVFVDLFAFSDWWENNEDMLVQVFAHEAGHAIYKADQKVRYNFKKVLDAQYAAETELEKYVKTYYDDWSWDEEMFAHMFQAWVTCVGGNNCAKMERY